MSLPWKTREKEIWVKADEEVAEIQVNEQQWTYRFGLRRVRASEDAPTIEQTPVEVSIVVAGVRTYDEARKLCELIAKAVAE